ncbi:hypothetical protein J3D54_004624 [Pseudomonas sp. GGS8]|uniref:hypothetical protein n=1 Tax=Pseudomonas sp. GGS8 TaxID=2817892 RepID=UPI0020A13A5D|nr:hypothetical protein [Pseudomonas sp. GGS8]MCP1445492.1 hypothetical protein [Pseudomonas sp. GGS8]
MIVSFQGAQLSPSQRRQLEFQRKAQTAFLRPVLAGQVSEAIKAVELRKEQGVKPEQVWFVERQEVGTSCLAEWMGF